MNSSDAGHTSAMARVEAGEVVGTRDIINTMKITANVSLTVNKTRDFAKMADLWTIAVATTEDVIGALPKDKSAEEKLMANVIAKVSMP